MMLVHPHIESSFQMSSGYVNSVVIENRSFFHEFVSDLAIQINYGLSGKAVLSDKDRILEMSKYAELIDSFACFDINRKSLISKITTWLEKRSISEDHYIRTSSLLSEIETLADELSMEIPCSLTLTKNSIGPVLKSVGIEICDDYENDLEKILDYMELVRFFDRNKLFIFVNMRGYYPDDHMELFLTSAIDKEFNVLLLDSYAGNKLINERRVTIDTDLCEF